MPLALLLAAALALSATGCWSPFMEAYRNATPSERERCEAQGKTWRETTRCVDGKCAAVTECGTR